MGLLKVGFIKKPHGIKGEIKVLPLTNNFNRFKKLKSIKIQDISGFIEYGVKSAKIGTDEVILKLDGINDRDLADSLREKYLFIDRNNGEKLNDWEYYTQDLIGLNVIYQEKTLGKVIDIINSGANDNLEIDFEGDTFFYPFLREFVDKVDLDNGLIIINCYEGFFD